MNPLPREAATSKQTHILEAAARVFAERGFHATTTRDIARAAGVAEGTLYNHFANKSALLLGVLELLSARIRTAQPPPDVAGLSLHALIETCLRAPLTAFSADDAELMRVILSELPVNPELRELFTERVHAPMLAGAEALLRDWTARSGVEIANLELKVRAVFGVVLGLLLQRFLDDPVLKNRWDDLPALLANLLTSGFVDESRPTPPEPPA